jgi:hypothetical protein
VAEYKLGKKSAEHDERTLRMAAYLGPELPLAPPSRDFTSKVRRWPMMLNDKIGDCTCAGAGHAIQQWTTYSSFPMVPTDAEIVEAYSRIAGYDPTDPSTDTGAVLMDVLKEWRKVGIAGHKIFAFVGLEKKNRTDLMNSVHLFGNAYIGLNLPRSARDQEIWSIAPGGVKIPENVPGSWGGHCVLVTSYDPGGLTIVTWGATKRMSWNFYDAYCDEAYAVLSPDWFDKSGLSPMRFKIDDLKADLARL